jgi:hypothetical protein
MAFHLSSATGFWMPIWLRHRSAILEVELRVPAVLPVDEHGRSEPSFNCLAVRPRSMFALRYVSPSLPLDLVDDEHMSTLLKLDTVRPPMITRSQDALARGFFYMFVLQWPPWISSSLSGSPNSVGPLLILRGGNQSVNLLLSGLTPSLRLLYEFQPRSSFLGRRVSLAASDRSFGPLCGSPRILFQLCRN